MPLYVIDTTLFSNFSHAKRADILRAVVADAAITTQKVLTELRAAEDAGYFPKQDYSWVAVASLDEHEVALADGFRRIVHETEAECLALAISRGAAFVSDDFAARRSAQSHGVTVSGTIGVLVVSIERRVLGVAEADALLRQMISRGYRSPILSLRELLE